MNVVVLSDPATVARTSADILAGAVKGAPELVLGLPTGRTAIPFYDELAVRQERGRIDLSRVRVFNLDELILPREHPASFHSYMRRHAWGRTGLDPARCDIPDGTADATSECRRYDAALADAGGLDLVFLGVGADGHVGYNLPGVPHPGTHVVELSDELAATLEVPAEWCPLRAITMGLEPIRSSARVVLMATGERKAEAVRALLEGHENPQWPCSLLRGLDNLEVILDQAASGR